LEVLLYSTLLLADDLAAQFIVLYPEWSAAGIRNDLLIGGAYGRHLSNQENIERALFSIKKSTLL
jgi:hypothetical protein